MTALRQHSQPTDDSRLLAAFPDYFIEAAMLLEELMNYLTAFPLGNRVLLHGQVPPDLIDRLAALGGGMADHEIDEDVEAAP